MFQELPKKVGLLFLIICGFLSQAAAQGKNFSISRTEPAWIVKVNSSGDTPKKKNISDGYYLSLLEDQNQAELQENYVHAVRQIVSGAGVQNGSQISVTYDPLYQKLTFHKIIVWRDGQPMDKLNARDFKVQQNEKELSRFIYSGTYEAYMILGDIRKGDRIEWAYTLKGKNPAFGNKFTDDFYFEGASTIGHRYTNLIINKNRSLKFRNFNFDKAPKTSERNGQKIYEWESHLTRTYDYADYEPSWYNPFKHTQISEYQSWRDVVDWGIKTNSYPNLKTPLLDKKASELQEEARYDTTQYMLLATRFVQDEIRYMGIEMGEYSQRPNSPEKVLQQRYGDCKDKSLLLIYLLKKMDVEAFMCYIDTYSGKKISGFLPSPTLFNHVVVMVDHHNTQTWIDPTISNQRGSFENTYFPNYGEALVLRPGTEKPEEVVSIATGKLIADLTFKVADTVKSAKTTLVIHSRYSDNYADDLRGQLAEDGEESMEKSFLDYIARYYPGIETADAIQFKDDEEKNLIEVTESYVIPNIWNKEKGENGREYTYFYGDLISNNLRRITDKNRSQPIALKYPINVEQNISIDFPFMPQLSNEAHTVETDNYYFELNTFLRGNNLKLNYVYRSLADHIAEQDIKKYTSDTEKINDLLAYTILRRSANGITAVNPYMIMLAIITLLATSFYFISIHQQVSAFDLDELADAKPIGGWLVIVGIVLVLLIFGIPSAMFRTNYFNQEFWADLKHYGIVAKGAIVAVSGLETIGYAIRFNWTILLTILFFNRRKEFPLQMIRYSIFVMAVFALHLVSEVLFDMSIGKFGKITGNLTQIVLAAGMLYLWLKLLHESIRIKETFVFNYPETHWKHALMQLKNDRFKAYLKSQNKSRPKPHQVTGSDGTVNTDDGNTDNKHTDSNTDNKHTDSNTDNKNTDSNTDNKNTHSITNSENANSNTDSENKTSTNNNTDVLPLNTEREDEIKTIKNEDF